MAGEQPTWQMKMMVPLEFAISTIDNPEGNFVEFVEYPDVASYRPDLYTER